MSKYRWQCRFRWFGVALALTSIVVSGTGCVQRRMTVRSNPPGAMVYIDDYPIGITPVSTDFTYYGTRKVRLVKDGYETLTVYQPVKTPWYDYFGIDFFTENLWPGEIRDERAYEYQMVPTVQVPPEQLISRAEQLRANSQPIAGLQAQPIVTPPPGEIITTPPGALLPPPPANIPSPSGTIPIYQPPGSASLDAPGSPKTRGGLL
jgi:hypothetical protein